MSALRGKRVVLGITGGIAAYKAAELCRLLVKAEADVRVVMTPAAEAFITPMTLQALSGHKVARHLLDASDEAEIGHIRLADEADLVVVAPATADAIARFAAGMGNDLLSTVVLATRAPVLLAPAMNVNMWENPLTQANLARLLETGRFSTVGPDAGPLACGWVGAGRMMEAEQICAAVVQRLQTANDLAGRKVVITAGPTHEPLDDVRFLGNLSSGKMGFALAESAAARGAHVVLIAGPVALATPPGISRRVDVQTALQMQAAVEAELRDAHVLVMTAAVADFRPATRASGKLGRRQGTPELNLVANPDILASVGAQRTGRQPLLVGFAAEVAESDAALLARAQAKLAEKRCDVIVANNVGDPTIGFSSDQNEGWLVFGKGAPVKLERAAKRQFAEALWASVTRLL